MEGLGKKREVMISKIKLKGEKIRIYDDLTIEERRVKKVIMGEAIKERGKENRVKVGYMKTWVNEKLRVWDEGKGGGNTRRETNKGGKRGSREKER